MQTMVLLHILYLNIFYLNILHLHIRHLKILHINILNSQEALFALVVIDGALTIFHIYILSPIITELNCYFSITSCKI